MAFQFKPLGGVATLDSAAGNILENAQCVFISTTADTTITLKATVNGAVTGSFQLVENDSVVILKETKEALFATGTTAKATKISYPRG